MQVSVILSCGAKKRDTACAAWRMYQGSYFGAALGWAQTIAPQERVYILSAKYGLIKCNMIIEPYEAQMGTATQIITEEEVAAQAVALELHNKSPVFIGGEAYRGIISKPIPKVLFLTDALAEGRRGMGYQISWLTRNHSKLPRPILKALRTT